MAEPLSYGRAAGQWPEFVCAENVREYYCRNINMREATMGKDDDGNSLDRRIFLGASTATPPRAARHQPGAATKPERAGQG